MTPPLPSPGFWPAPIVAGLRACAGLLDAHRPITAARAPGRLDVIGGVADYSGSVVLEATLGEAAWALLQPRRDGVVRLVSIPPGEGHPLSFETTVDVLGAGGKARAPAKVEELFRARPEDRWAAYLAGCWTILAEARPGVDLSGGADMLLISEVPLGAGVSSSAAIEVATMRALAAACGARLEGMELARLCQRVENEIALAPCGVMDQVTSALGREGELLALRCQPHELLGYHAIPRGCSVVGLDTGAKHSVGGSPYTKARVAAFMGHRILTHVVGDDPLGGYLANLTPERYRAEFADRLPERMGGREFLAAYGATVDPVTRVDPDETYMVRACAEHPIYENARVERFARLLEEARRAAIAEDEGRLRSALTQMGDLMYASHASYGENCGLGSDEADFLVTEVRRRGPAGGLFGAKITGGGCGGTVAVLMHAGDGGASALEEVRGAYTSRYGVRPRLFSGTSPGAMAWEPSRFNIADLPPATG